MYFFLPSLPATPGERRSLRPIAHHSEHWQQMFAQVVEISRMVEDLGFSRSGRSEDRAARVTPHRSGRARP